MKRITTLGLLVVIFATSCQTSSELGSTSLIQKRRYTKGFNLNVKTPALANNDEKRIEENVQLIEAETISAANFMAYPGNNLKSEKENKSDLAAIELSESLMKKDEKETKDESEIAVAAPTALNDAYPLTLGNKTGTNLNYSTAASMAASGEVNLLIIIITILLPPLGVALVFGLSTEFWISLILTLLFYIPGLIYSLVIIL